MGNSSFSPGINRRSPQRHEWEDSGYIAGPLAISLSFFHHLGSLGSCLRPPRARRRAVSSAVPFCECTQPHRSHPCRRDMDLTATASPDSATSNAFPSAEPLGFWGSGDGLWCKRFVRARHGLVVHGIWAVRPNKPGVFRAARSDQCKVPDIVLLLSPRMTRGMRTTEARTGKVRYPPLPTLPTQRSQPNGPLF